MFNFSEKQRVLKNFISISLSFVLLYSAVNSNGSVQAIFNQRESLGTISQALQFFTEVCTTLVLPQIIFETIGFKFSIIFGNFLQLTCNLILIF